MKPMMIRQTRRNTANRQSMCSAQAFAHIRARKDGLIGKMGLL